MQKVSSLKSNDKVNYTKKSEKIIEHMQYSGAAMSAGQKILTPDNNPLKIEQLKNCWTIQNPNTNPETGLPDPSLGNNSQQPCKCLEGTSWQIVGGPNYNTATGKAEGAHDVYGCY